MITAALQTPFTKGGIGGFKDTPRRTCSSARWVPSRRAPASTRRSSRTLLLARCSRWGGATEFRTAALVAGFLDWAAVGSLNRYCSSGLEACIDIVNAISAGMIEVGISAGVESMSL